MPSSRELYIVRHAKSTWDYEDISDIDRPLKHSGIRSAYEMARRLKINGYVPDYLISSPANRALHTANIFLNVFEIEYDKLRIEPAFYSEGAGEILELIKSLSATLKKVMIFGHNPDFSELVRFFAKQPILELPTCGVMIFKFDCKEWNNISRENLKSEYLDFPKKE
jgi:phosphohistidine phosphatase